MLFNSFAFAVFLPIVFFLYWFVVNKSYKTQNLLLLVASYYFYACWDWRFMFLLLFSTLLDFITGLKMEEANSLNKKRFWFWLSITINLGFLCVFKYYNFFAESFALFVSAFGFSIHPKLLHVILPVGISFYTFHGLSYVIDIYNKKIKAEKNFVDYAVFVSFFPLLVAGPIERATHLLPQIQKKRHFNYTRAVDGLRQILWGFFKKIVIADNCATFADKMFNNTADNFGVSLWMGAVFFAIQIYGDFSGYSDIALGTARLFGIELLKNFAYPYFSRDIAEFWRRWHISLSTWFRDYLYIPLGGSKGDNFIRIRNTFIIFIVSGFWHGANWTFIIWGVLNAVFIMPSVLLNTNRNNLEIVAKGRFFPTLNDFFAILITFSLTTVAWVFFRASSLTNALLFLKNSFLGLSPAKAYTDISEITHKYLAILLLSIFLIIVEWLGRENKFALEKLLFSQKRVFRWLFYAIIVFMIGFYMKTEETPFIYFQF